MVRMSLKDRRDREALRAEYRNRYETMSSEYVSQELACRIINHWLMKSGYDCVFKQDVRCILTENRRETRASNVGKYGRIPFFRGHTGKVVYHKDAIRDLIANRIRPICVELERERAELAERAGLVRRHAT